MTVDLNQEVNDYIKRCHTNALTISAKAHPRKIQHIKKYESEKKIKREDTKIGHQPDL